MKPIYTLSMVTVLVLFSCGIQRQESRSSVFINPQFPVKVTRDLVYATAPVQSSEAIEKALRLDLYEPDGKTAPRLRPGFIAIHGGGLANGDKQDENMVELCRELAARGYTCASINYRLVGDDPPVQGASSFYRALNAAIEDTAQSVTWLRNNADRYHVDASRIAVGGSSAGAHIALRFAYGETSRKTLVAAVLSWTGGLNGDEDIIEGDEPALFIVHGADDDSVPVTEARALARRAARIGLPYKILICEGLGHLVPLDRRPAGVPLYGHFAEFLYQNMDIANLGQPVSRRRSTAQNRDAKAQTDLRAVQCPR